MNCGKLLIKKRLLQPDTQMHEHLSRMCIRLAREFGCQTYTFQHEIDYFVPYLGQKRKIPEILRWNMYVWQTKSCAKSMRIHEK
jgi:hypothetical protein